MNMEVSIMSNERVNEKTNKRSEDVKENGKVEVVFILDRSGSMSGLEADTIGGFNAMLREQKAKSNDIIWSTVLFDHLPEVVHDRVPVDKVSELDRDTYYVRGSTALLDAVGGAIHHIGNVHKYAREEDRPMKTMFVITTDGMENSSCLYDYRRVKMMIERQKERYGWEFIFLGANIDAAETAGRMGIDASHAARYHCDDEGIAMNYRTGSQMVTTVAECGSFDASCLENVRKDYKSRKAKR